MKPKLSYIIWFSQRTGSTVLCRALEDTGVAGKPDEHLYDGENCDLLKMYGAEDYGSVREKLWNRGMTGNGVFGIKVGMCCPHHIQITEQFRRFPGCPKGDVPRAEVWGNVFPNCRHIFMTRRNRVRLAVSWWKAIRSGEFHRKKGGSQGRKVEPAEYDFDAIKRLILDADMREAGIQEFFSEGGIKPLTIAYEDFLADHSAVIRRVLDFLEIPGGDRVETPPLRLQKLADRVSEEWVQRFRRELQMDWKYRGWGWPKDHGGEPCP